ncbi:MAG: FAD-binding oxidoreductase [Acidimicrobiales bacterium]|nr:FAD-binding oxidoreductase [Acidimicrobiales bacterium]
MAPKYAVVGSGLIGSAAARHLAEAGNDVTLIGVPEERSAELNTFASHHDEGRVTRIVDPDPVWSIAARRSIERYGDIEARSGINFHDRAGLVYSSARVELAAEIGAANGAQVVLRDAAWIAERYGIALAADTQAPVAVEAGAAGAINPRRMVAAQRALAAAGGAALVDDRVTAVDEHAGGVTVVTTSSARFEFDSVVLATGPYGAAAAGVDLLLERRLRTVALARPVQPESLVLPSLIADDVGREDIDGVYWTPPSVFADGNIWLKIGGDALDVQIASGGDDIGAWFAAGGHQAEADMLAEVLQASLPAVEFAEWAHKPCVVTYTAHGRPYVGQVSERLVVAVGGCGGAAKSADEWGRLASVAATGGAEDPEIGWDTTKPIFVGDGAYASVRDERY